MDPSDGCRETSAKLPRSRDPARGLASGRQVDLDLATRLAGLLAGGLRDACDRGAVGAGELAVGRGGRSTV